jgi:hypothetical protein
MHLVKNVLDWDCSLSGSSLALVVVLESVTLKNAA